MARKDYYKGITIQYKGDATELSAVLANMNKDMRQSQGAARALNTALKFDSKNTDLIKDKMVVLTRQLDTTKSRVEALKAALGKAEDPEVITRLTQQLHIAESKVKTLEQSIKELGNQTSISGKLEDVGSKMSGIGDKLTMSVTAPIVALGTLTVKTATDIDSALTDVKKTVDGTAEEYESLKNAAIEYSKTNAVSAEEVLQVQALGAQLGYTVSELEMIGRVGTGLDIATNMNAEQATTEMAQFANITKMAHSESENYASTIVALGNSTATTESKISSMAQRIAAAGSQVGMSNSEILGLAAGLSSVGMEAEAGGTAISTIISQIDKDVATGSKNVEVWAATADMSTEQFASAWKNKPVEALQALLTNMGELADTGSNMSVMLDNLGISSIRQTDAMKRLAGNSEALSTAVRTANQAWQENTALSEEVANRNDSLAAKMQMLKNRVTAILEKIGKPVADALLSMLDAAQPLFDAIEGGAKAFADMDKGTQQLILSAVGLVAALGPVLSVTGRMTSGVADLIKVVGKVGPALSGVSVGAAAATAGLAALVAYVAGDVITTISGIVQNAELVNKATNGVAETTKLVTDNTGSATEALSDFAGAADGAAGSSGALSAALKEANEGLQAAADYADTAKDKMAEVGADSSMVDQYVNSIRELCSQGELTATQQEQLKNAVSQYNDITGSSVEVTDALSGTLNVLPGQIDEVTEAYKRQALQQTYLELYNEAIKAQAKNEQELASVTKQMGDAYDDAGTKLKVGFDIFSQLSNMHTYADVIKLQQSFEGLKQSGDELANNVSYWEQMLESLGDSSYQFTTLEAAMTAAGVTGQQMASLTEAQLAELRAAFDGTIDSIQSKLSKFGISVGDVGSAMVDAASDATEQYGNAMASGIDNASQQAIRAQQRANEAIIKEQQRANNAVIKQMQKANETVLKQQQKVNEQYNKQLQKQFESENKQLQKQLEKEIDARSKANEKILKSMKKANEEETKIYKQETSARIKEMEREYKRKIELLEQNDGTSEIDDKIKALKDENEAEKRASTEREENEKIAELRLEVSRAKSRRKRAEAEKELNDYLAEIAEKKREQERNDEIDRLEERKESIKDETDLEKDRIREQYEYEKEEYQRQRDEKAERDAEAFDEEYERRREALDAELEQRREHNSEILEQKREAQQEYLDSVREAQQSEIDSIRDAQQEELDAVREGQQDQLDELRQSQQDQLDAMRDSQGSQVETVRQANKQKADDTKKANADMVSDAKSTNEALAGHYHAGSIRSLHHMDDLAVGAKSTADSVSGDMERAGQSAENMADSIGSGAGHAIDETQRVADGIEDALSEPSYNSGMWGSDMILNFSNAMVDYWNNTLWPNLQSMAQNIQDVFGHSKPKMGPLKDDDLWFLHMMENYNEGVERGKPMLMRSLDDVASMVEGRLNPSSLSARYDANLNIATRSSADRLANAWQAEARDIHVNISIDDVSMGSDMDIRTTARMLAAETARELNATIA